MISVCKPPASSDSLLDSRARASAGPETESGIWGPFWRIGVMLSVAVCERLLFPSCLPVRICSIYGCTVRLFLRITLNHCDDNQCPLSLLSSLCPNMSENITAPCPINRYRVSADDVSGHSRTATPSLTMRTPSAPDRPRGSTSFSAICSNGRRISRT